MKVVSKPDNFCLFLFFIGVNSFFLRLSKVEKSYLFLLTFLIFPVGIKYLFVSKYFFELSTN